MRLPSLQTALPALVAFSLCVACADDDVAARVTSFRFEPAVLAEGETTRITWSVKYQAHIEQLKWASLFQGAVDEHTVDDEENPNLALAVVLGREEGTFVCTYRGERLACEDPDEDEESSDRLFGSKPLPIGTTVFTLRACLTGLTGDAEPKSQADCAYRSAELTLLP